MIRKGIALLFAFIFICVTFVGVVQAQNFQQMEVDVNLNSRYADRASGTEMNLGIDQSKDQESWPIPIEGVYWGPIIPVSKISLKVGEVVSFSTDIFLSNEVVASGCSEYWVRVPIDGHTVKSFEFSFDNYPAIKIENRNTNDIVWDENGVFLKYTFPILPGYNQGLHTFNIVNATPYDNMAIRPLITQEDYTETMQQNVTVEIGDIVYSTNTGVPFAWAFVFLRGYHKTGAYTVSMEADVDPIILGWNKFVADETRTVFSYFMTGHEHGMPSGVSFVAEDGTWQTALREGYTAFSVGNDILNQTIQAGAEVWVYFNASGWYSVNYNEPYIKENHIYHRGTIEDFGDDTDYVTVTMPFVGRSSFSLILKTQNAYTGAFDGFHNMFFLPVDEVEDYLAVTFPRPVFVWEEESPGVPTGDLEYEIYIIPHSDITLLSYGEINSVPFNASSPADATRTFVNQRYNDYEHDYYYTVDSENLTLPNDYYKPTNVFLTVEHTEGVFSIVNYTAEYKHYDFGWGEGYIYPGDLTLYIQLDENVSFFYTSRTELMYNQDTILTYYKENESIAPEYAGTTGLLYEAVRQRQMEDRDIWNGISGVVGSIWDSIYETVTWIYDTLISFITKMVAFIEEAIIFIGWQIYGVILSIMSFSALMVVSLMVGFTEGGDSEVSRQLEEQKKFFKGARNKAQKKIDNFKGGE